MAMLYTEWTGLYVPIISCDNPSHDTRQKRLSIHAMSQPEDKNGRASNTHSFDPVNAPQSLKQLSRT